MIATIQFPLIEPPPQIVAGCRTKRKYWEAPGILWDEMNGSCSELVRDIKNGSIEYGVVSLSQVKQFQNTTENLFKKHF